MSRQQLEQLLLEETGIVNLGDASIAAPFTSRRASINSIVDLMRHGRSSLVVMLLTFKTLGISSLVSSVTLMMLRSSEIKLGEMQQMMIGMVFLSAFFMSSAKPKETLSRARPLPHILNAYFILTVLAQAAIHFGLFYSVSSTAETFLSEPLGAIVKDAPFTPNLMATVLFYCYLWATFCNYAVNYEVLGLLALARRMCLIPRPFVLGRSISAESSRKQAVFEIVWCGNLHAVCIGVRALSRVERRTGMRPLAR